MLSTPVLENGTLEGLHTTFRNPRNIQVEGLEEMIPLFLQEVKKEFTPEVDSYHYYQARQEEPGIFSFEYLRNNTLYVRNYFVQQREEGKKYMDRLGNEFSEQDNIYTDKFVFSFYTEFPKGLPIIRDGEMVSVVPSQHTGYVDSTIEPYMGKTYPLNCCIEDDVYLIDIPEKGLVRFLKSEIKPATGWK